MFFKPFDKILGEFRRNVDVHYLGDVEDNNDPLKLGRLKVRISIFEDIDTEQLPWCFPLLPSFLGNSKNSIMFSVPEIGSQVRVSFPNRDIYTPFYSSADLTTGNKCTFFDEDYPDSYGFKDSKGNFVKINKKTNEITIQHSTSSNIVIDSFGDFYFNHKDGNSFEMRASGMKIEAPNTHVDGTLTVSTGASTIITATDGRQLTFNKGILVNVV